MKSKYAKWQISKLNLFIFVVVTDKQQVINIQRTNTQEKIANRQTALRQQADNI